MAWNANEKGNPAWLTKTASEHGGVDQFIDDIKNEGFQDGHEKGMVYGSAVTLAVVVLGIGAYEGIKHLIQKHKAKKQMIKEHSEDAEAKIRQICNDESFDNELDLEDE